MAKYQEQQIKEPAFEWPECEAPHPDNLTLASKLCTSLLRDTQPFETAITHFPSGWSSNDVIQVSITTRTCKRRIIVKLPRRQISSPTTSCEREALRTRWAAAHGFGPQVLALDGESGGFAMERVEGQTLAADMSPRRLLQATDLLRKIHDAAPADWMRKFDPVAVVRKQLDCVKKLHAMNLEEVRMIESILNDTGTAVHGHPWVPCHNDFHSHNIMLQQKHSRMDHEERLLAIDFEDCDLADPMWDLAYLTVNVEMEREPYLLWDRYGATLDEKRRARAYIPLAVVHCATWAAMRGGPWVRHQNEMMVRI
ncbi:MAG: hypothetical protein Q9182_004877 [Xanthomendoza sp. 2 TL-2023]